MKWGETLSSNCLFICTSARICLIVSILRHQNQKNENLLKKKLLAILFLLFAINISIYAEIFGRITGIVKDASTNNGISSANVYLYRFDDENKLFEDWGSTTSRNNGSFSFLKLRSGRYVIICEHPKYVTNFIADEIVSASELFLKSNLLLTINRKKNLYVEIKLERAGNLSGRILKNEGTISGFQGVEISVYRKRNEKDFISLNSKYVNYDAKKTDKDGRFYFNSLMPAANYEVEISVDGLPIKKITNLAVTAENTTEISHTYNLNDITGIFGKITRGGQPPTFCSISILLLDPTNEQAIAIASVRNTTGLYSFKNIPTGNYKMIFTLTGEGPILIKKTLVRVTAGESTSVNIDF